MNIAQNLDRIEAAVNSIKLTARQKGVGNASTVDEAAVYVEELKSPYYSEPEYVVYDGSISETPFLFGRDTVTMQILDIHNGVLATGMDYNDNNRKWDMIKIVDNHLIYGIVRSAADGGGEFIMSDPEPIDNEIHTWGFDYDRLFKDGVVIATTEDFLPDFSTRNIRGVLFRSSNDGLYQGKVRIYDIDEYRPMASDASAEARLINKNYFLDWNHWDGVLPNGLYGTLSYSITSVFKKYQNKYELSTLNVDASTSSQTFDASSNNLYGYSSVTVNAVDSSIDNNIQQENIKEGVTILGVTGTFVGSAPAELEDKTIEIDLDTDSQDISSDNYDGLGTVSIDASALNMQRTNILNNLLGIAGSSIIDPYISEYEAEMILNELNEI